MNKQTALLMTPLSSIHIFRDLSEAELWQISPHFASKSFKAGEVITPAGSATDEVMVLFQGLAKAHSSLEKGKDIVFRYIRAGEFFGDLAAIDGKTNLNTITAEADCWVGSIKEARFVDIVSSKPCVAIRQMRALTSQLRDLTKDFSGFLMLSATARVQQLLMEYATQTEHGLLINQLPTHSEIANRAHTQREVVARELNQLIRQGVLCKSGKGLQILKPDLLGAKSSYV